MRSVIFALVLAACGNARIIQMTPTGGTIELQDDRSKAMEQATGQMNQKCGPNNFTIVQEGWETTDPSRASQDPSGGPTTDSNGGTSHTGMAWRIHFQCNGAIGSAQPIDQPPIAPPGTAPPTPAPPAGEPAPAPGY
jgi:hypothetical protein